MGANVNVKFGFYINYAFKGPGILVKVNRFDGSPNCVVTEARDKPHHRRSVRVRKRFAVLSVGSPETATTRKGFSAKTSNSSRPYRPHVASSRRLPVSSLRYGHVH